MKAPVAVTLDPTHALKPADYHRLAGEIARLDGRREPVHVLSSFSGQFLEPLLLVESYQAGLFLDLSFGPYGQLEQELHNSESALWRSDRPAAVVLFRPEDVEPDLYFSTRSCALPERLAQLEDRLATFATQFRKKSHGPLFVANAAPAPSTEAGTPSALGYALETFNAKLAVRLSEVSDCHVFDWSAAVADFGSLRWQDPRLWYLARIPCSQEAAAFVSQRLARRLASIMVSRAKCVVLDLDDTLWGGVIGDDGVEGIRLGGDYPGNVFKDFQLRLKELTRKGILLAIASKNDEANVREAFARHPEMVLSWEDFASHRINWGRKEDSILQIAEELNIGCDSMVFLDDSPVECAAVQRGVPGIQVVLLGRDPLQFQSILSSIGLLDRPILTLEDKTRTSMYQQARRRSQHEGRSQSKEEFLASLEMKGQAALCDAVSLPRVVQLIAKTNQFNLTTRRYSHDQVRAMLEDEVWRVVTLRLADIYGDLGLVGVAILRRADPDPAEWHIDVLVMSCRVMSRGVEDALLAFLQECAREAGAAKLVGQYIPSARNAVVREFYSQHGFVGTAQDAQSGAPRFHLDLSEGGTPWPAHILRLP